MSLLLTDRWFDINEKAIKHPEQIRLKEDLDSRQFQYYTIVGGRRTFKTERFLKRWTVANAIENNKTITMLGAPTRQQAKNIFWDDIKALIRPFLIKNYYDSELKVNLINGSTIEIIGLKEFERQEGKRAHVVAITEFQQCDPKAYTQSLQPMIIDTGGIGIFDGRPFGKNHLFDFYTRGMLGEEGWSSYHWNAEDILSVKQIRQAKKDLSADDYNREYRASFETAMANPYSSYSVENNIPVELNTNTPLIIACDFNATEKPMSWVIGQKQIYKKELCVFWKKSFRMQYTNTRTMCDVLNEYIHTNFPEYWSRKNRLELHFYGDYAGEHKTSNSSITDWKIIEDYFKRLATFKKFIKPCISVRSSVGSTNSRLCNALGERRQFVDHVGCKELVEDWLKVEWEENGYQLKESSNPLLGHLCRAVDYFNEYEYPIYNRETIIS